MHTQYIAKHAGQRAIERATFREYTRAFRNGTLDLKCIPTALKHTPPSAIVDKTSTLLPKYPGVLARTSDGQLGFMHNSTKIVYNIHQL